MRLGDFMINSLKEEIVHYSEPDWFQTMEYVNLSKTPLGYTPLHWHKEFQFLVAVNGSFELKILGKKINLSEGMGCFINSGVVHEVHPVTINASYICWNIGISLFDKHIQTKYILPLTHETSTPYIILHPLNDRHKRVIQAILNSYDAFTTKNNGFELIMTIQYLTCLHELLPEVDLESTDQFPIYDPRVKMILEYIHTHYKDQIKLETLAEMVHLSKAETIRVFKKHVGRTPFQYILDHRLERSINLLLGTKSTITEIAFACGFSSVSYFIEKFKEAFHMTPNRYRDKKKNRERYSV